MFLPGMAYTPSVRVSDRVDLGLLKLEGTAWDVGHVEYFWTGLGHGAGSDICRDFVSL